MLVLEVYIMMDKQTTNYYRIEKAISFLAENFREQPSLEEVAQKIHLSPFHLFIYLVFNNVRTIDDRLTTERVNDQTGILKLSYIKQL